MGGFALNDYYDADKDKINKPHRPLPNKRISDNNVLGIAIYFLTLGFILATYNVVHDTIDALQLVFLVAVVLYNFLIRKWGIVKAAYTALVCAMLVSYPILSHPYVLDFVLLPIASFFFIFGRETLMDILDMRGDKMSGILTLPMIIGSRRSFAVALASILLGTTIVLPLLVDIPNLLRTLVITTTILSFLGFWPRSSNKQRRIALLFLWVPMITTLSILWF